MTAQPVDPLNRQGAWLLWPMLWRETRGAWRQFLFFLACCALGVASLVGVSGFSISLEQSISREARAMMAADVEVRTSQPLDTGARGVLEALNGRGVAMTTASEMVAMAVNPRSGATQLIELKAVGEGYPYYGALTTRPADAAALSIPSNALVEDSLLIRLGLEPGEPLRLGRAVFTIGGVIVHEPDRVAGAFSLGPRVMISQEALPATGLVQRGSRVRYRYLLKLPPAEEAAALVEELTPLLAGARATVTAYDDAQPRLQRFLDNLVTYLGLVGLIALFVGGIGVANSVQAFLRSKLETIATMKCLGASSGAILRLYLVQALLLGGLGCLLGIGLGVAVQWLLPLLLADLLPVPPALSFSWLPVWRGLALGLLTTLLFAMWPLLAIGEIPPARLYRRDVEEDQLAVGGRRPWLAGAGIVAGLVLLALWQIGSFDIGATFIGVLSASLLMLWLAAGGLIRLLKATPRRGPLAWRQGLANLYRPGSYTLTAVLSVGIGVTVILCLYLIEADLLRHVDENLPKEAPSFFFIDIQPDQRERFDALFRERGLAAELTPIVRTRLQAIDGATVAELAAAAANEPRSDDWYVRREYVVTQRQELPAGNRVTAGTWWDDAAGANGPSISIDEHAAEHLGVTLGSTLTFDLQGRELTATITSLREVTWTNLSVNFFIIFSPGALDGVPVTYIATARTPQQEDIALQRAVVAAFPNVTAINIRHVLDTVQRVLERIALVVRFMALFTILAGLIVLAGAIATTRYRRIRESIILKTLGATRAVVARIFAVEYAVLGAVAGLIGALMATLLAWILLYWFLDVPWRFQPGALTVGLAAAAALCMLTGFLTTHRILGRKPLEVLRHE